MGERPRMLPMAQGGVTGPAPVFERIAVVGLGLVGGSVALAARRAWPSALVIGVDRNAVLERATARRAVDVAAEDLMIVSEADLVVLATPTGVTTELLPTLGGRLLREAVVTDVGSTKRAVLAAARSLPPRLSFVGGHPLAGAPTGGIDAARADLFNGRPWILIDGGDGRSDVVGRLSAFVEGLGARPRTIASAADHDRLMAFLYQLPQAAASALMAVVGDQVGEAGLELAGQGLDGATRLAESRADVWKDVCTTNGDKIGVALDALVAVLQDLRRGVSDRAAIDRIFDAANRWRQRLSDLDDLDGAPAS